ncbi:MAG: serine/threonine protein kinase [Deltaproteobacteria bacterium]|nr:serine/threonine protein kinase [Deltaproteobacteria bacterium]
MKFCPACQGTFDDQDQACPKDGTDLVPEVGELGSAAEDLQFQVLEKKYLLESVLGTGGMGFVYRARHLLLERFVAIKVLRPELVAVPELRKRFLREAKAACETEHPGIVDVIDFGVTATGIYYLVMELLVGESMYLYLRRRGKLPFDDAVSLTLDILDALGAVHARGIVHRDVKPDNFVVMPERSSRPQVKMVDFGLAKVFEEKPGQAEDRITRGSVIMGSPKHMSPEQARGLDLDERSDLYSVGCILYEMCTGRVPFMGATSVEVISKQLAEEVQPPSSIRQDMGPGLERIILGCLAKDRDQRFSNAREVAQAIRTEFPEAAIHAAEPGLETIEPEPPSAATTPDMLNVTERQTRPAGMKRVKRTPRGMRIAGFFGLVVAMIVGFGVLDYQMSSQWEIDGPVNGPPLESSAAEVGSPVIPATPDAPVAKAATRSPPVKAVTNPKPRETPPPPPPAEARPEPAPVVVTVSLATVPAGARVVDGQGNLLGRTPLTLKRAMGSTPVKLTLAKRGFRKHSLDLAFDRDRKWDLRLKRLSSRTKAKPKKKSRKAGTKKRSGFMDPF